MERLQRKNPRKVLRALAVLVTAGTMLVQSTFPWVWGSSPVSREIWALFDFILAIGIITGIIVMGSLFYVVLRFRDRPTRTAGN